MARGEPKEPECDNATPGFFQVGLWLTWNAYSMTGRQRLRLYL